MTHIPYQWIPLEDIELVDGNAYRISDGECIRFIATYVEDFHEFMVLTVDKFLPPVDAEMITHVIHLPIPQTPKGS